MNQVHVLVAVALALFGWALAGCSADDDSGEFECRGADCVCPSSGDCSVRCTDECNLQCAGSGTCDFICDEACSVACTGSGPCLVDVADGSQVACRGSGGCDVACAGDCTLECPGSGECIARCKPGFVCTIERCSGEPVTCRDGIQVCNGSCPK